jgi:hypothetical protein
MERISPARNSPSPVLFPNPSRTGSSYPRGQGDMQSGSDGDVVVEFSDTISLLKHISREKYLSELLVMM